MMYQGGGQGENEVPHPEVEAAMLFEPEPMDADFNNEYDLDLGEDTGTMSNELPLLFFFDVETTGLVVYNDFIIDIAAKVVDIPPESTNIPVCDKNKQDHS